MVIKIHLKLSEVTQFPPAVQEWIYLLGLAFGLQQSSRAQQTYRLSESFSLMGTADCMAAVRGDFRFKVLGLPLA
jgi:hypothetical protein